jgi:hypothetical protein
MIICWRLVSRNIGGFTVEFWPEDDESQRRKEDFVILEEQRLKFRFQNVFKAKEIRLKKVESRKSRWD